MDDKVKYLKDYKKPGFQIDKIDLVVEIAKDFTQVTNSMKITKTSADSELILDGIGHELVEVSINGKTLDKKDYRLTDYNLTLLVKDIKFDLKIISKTKPQANTSLEGLYLAKDIYLTQCEAEGFRKITYFLDRPDVMSIYTTKIIADKKYPILLANGDLIEQGELPDNRHFAVWHDKSKKPSYLFAMVVGDLKLLEDNFITKSGKKIALKIYVPEHDILKADYAMYSLKDSMKWDEEKFGREYDLNTYMIVGTPMFNMGAMENKGLNVFNDLYMLANPDIATDANYQAVYSVIGHEYFHNWTGNRITVSNWFQLSLKEGLTVFRDQEFSADKFGRTIKRIEDVNNLKNYQFQEDAGALSHPVQPQSYIKMDNFYTSTVYDKGAELIRMQKTIIGEKNFAKAMDIYFNKYDGMAVTIEEFVKSMEEASKIDLSQFRLWYSQSGTPHLDVKTSYDKDKKTYSLNIKQYCKNQNSGNKAFYIPIKLGLIGSVTGDELKFEYEGKTSNELVIILKDMEQNFTFNNVSEMPIISILRDFSAPVKINYEYSEDELLFLLENDKNEFNKWDAGQNYYNKILLKLIKQAENGQELTISDKLIPTIKSLLASNMPKEMIAETIRIPSAYILYDTVDIINPDAISKARNFLLKKIGAGLKEDFLNIYNLTSLKEYSLSKEDIANRALKNICLDYISYGDLPKSIELAKNQLKSANNLTDRLAALKILVNDPDYSLVDEFYETWKNEEIIVNKWLSIQTTARGNNTSEKVFSLLKHKAFDVKIPNKIYALIGGFTQNSEQFHSLNENNYDRFANFIIEIDKLNPSVSSLLTKKFSTWKKFEPVRKERMKKILEKIKDQPNLSENLKEIVEKILG